MSNLNKNLNFFSFKNLSLIFQGDLNLQYQVIQSPSPKMQEERQLQLNLRKKPENLWGAAGLTGPQPDSRSKGLR